MAKTFEARNYISLTLTIQIVNSDVNLSGSIVGLSYCSS
nr:hypothetical protein [Bacillus sp. AFS040349]